MEANGERYDVWHQEAGMMLNICLEPVALYGKEEEGAA